MARFDRNRATSRTFGAVPWPRGASRIPQDPQLALPVRQNSAWTFFGFPADVSPADCILNKGRGLVAPGIGPASRARLSCSTSVIRPP